ncbi:unnamed protein product [Adineta steineri]|uniref:Glutamate receptor n=1 Tax=Adineta steineri TaxID=433720 RepID=A0A815MX41_9BILA|nr:unnamed protein product [Adineta steineri]CAF3984862.1 unnamed protein product [Adineta steineri]
MVSRWNYQWLLLYFIFGQHYVIANWTSSNVSDYQILGLFRDDITTNSSIHCRAMFKAAILLSQQYNITIDGQYIGWESSQTNEDIMNTFRSTCQAVSNSNILGIVGPSLSREAEIIAPFGKTIGIPVVSYAATDPDLSDRNNYPAFYRTVPSDQAAAIALMTLFLRFNWTSCLIIYQNDAYGSNGAEVITNAFVNNNLTVKSTIIFDIATEDIQGNLETLLINSPTRTIVVWAEALYTSLILQKALDVNVLGSQFTWILSTSISLTSFNQTDREKLIGILTVEPVTASIVNAPINTTLLHAAYELWQKYEPETFPGSTNVDYYALFAFDAAWLLIQSLQQLCSIIENNSSSCLSFNESSFCFDHHFINSDLLLNIMSTTKFLGVSGLIEFNNNSTDRINGSYYYAQNVQSGIDFTPVLEYVDTGEWQTYTGANVIVWPGNSLIIPTDRALLQGVTLRIGVIQETPFTIVTNSTDASGNTTVKFTGYMPALIELLRQNMGFIPDIQLTPSNLTYDQVIEAVANGIYDIVVSDATITDERLEIVDFSTSIFDNSLRVMIRVTPSTNINLLSYLKPFSYNLWLIVLAATIYAGILLYFLERSENETLQQKTIISAIAMSIWFSFGNIVGYGADFTAKTPAGRLLTIGLYILSLVLVASYTANLASDLTISKSTDIISGVDDIKNGKISSNRIGIIVGTAFEDYYLRDISGGISNYYPLESIDQLYSAFFEGKIDATIIDGSYAEYVTNNIYCNLTLVGADFDKSNFGIVVPKGWLYLQDLNLNILSLKEAGNLDDLESTWFGSSTCSAVSETTTAMGVNAMAGLFLTFLIITILSLLLFLWNKVYLTRHKLFGLCERKK